MPSLQDCRRVFFSFPHVTDPARWDDYHRWHLLDHQPQNLALPGVLHGDRWVRTPECRAAAAVDSDPALTKADHVAMYWFADPVRESLREWYELGRTTGEQGRRPELAWTERPVTGFFRPLGGVVADGVTVTAEALPYRRHAGVVLEVLRVDTPGSAVADEQARHWHTEVLPAVRRHEGVAGTWTFASRDLTMLTGGEPEKPAAGTFQVALHFCASDPIAVAGSLPAPGADVVLRTPLISARLL
ncbi:hypothetical protein [Nocardioides alcanivorans]|uniref:hypothetical protein n=1 Tax=Nocardioides alcanivorans TaxID=2897352 RepID=UPI001F39C258|nr:hypothetical protein [Nocardioides alcanivorans]